MEKDFIITALERWKARTGNESFHLKAALIDMDGTLYDSMRNHTASWYRLMTELGVDCTQDEFYLYEGMTGAATITKLWQRQLHRDPEPELITELYHRKTVYFNELPKAPTIDGAIEMTHALMDAGVKTILVTGSGQPSVLDRLDVEFKGIFPPGHRVTARDVTKGKPFPEPYLKGMQLAGVKAFEAIAIENAPIGIESAVAAGAFTIAVTTGPIPRNEFVNKGADLIFDSMRDLAAAMPEIIETLS